MVRRNGIDLDVLAKTRQEFEKNPAAARRTNVVEGRWDPETGQFVSEIEWGGRTHVIRSEQPPFMGGTRRELGPLHYCLYGSAACYVGTLVSVAAEAGIDLGTVQVRIENDINFRPVLGLSDEPIVEQVRIHVKVSAPLDEATLRQLKEQADRHCPGMYCLTKPIPVETVVTAG